MEAFLIYGLVTLLVLIGLVGTVAPALPGPPVIFLGILIYALYVGVESFGLSVLITLAVVAILAQILDYLAGAYGATRYGSTRWGVAGSIIGGIVGGIVFNLIGLLLGIFLGAMIAEIIFAKKKFNESFKIGWGSILGFFGGTIVKVILGIAMVITFLVVVFL